MTDRNFFLAVTLLLGTVIGAGIFGIPYVISKSGILPGFFYLLILGGIVLLIHLLFGEIILRTHEKHRLPGYAKIYLGKWGEVVAAFSTVFGMIAVLLAYIILGGDFLEILISPFTRLSSFYLSLIFWLILSPFIFRGIKFIAVAELFTNFAFILIIISIFYLSIPSINFKNFNLLDFPNLFLPYGVVLFALTGWSAIPEMADIFKTSQERQRFKRAIFVSMTIAILLYCLFSLAVIGVSGSSTSVDTFSGLLSLLNKKVIFLGVLAGVITLADSFLILGLYLRNTLIYDYKFSKIFAFLVSCVLPLLLFLSGFRQFIEVIGWTGSFIGAMEGIIIILIFQKAKFLGNRDPEYNLKLPSPLLYTLMVMLLLGAISHLFLS